jgi:hypothetical protein
MKPLKRSIATASLVGASDAARVTSRQALRYSAGADPTTDRPPHVRAGSGCAFISLPGVGWRLAVVQDDAAFVALVDVATGIVDVVELAARDGVRQFDATRGNKMDKLDLESVCVVAIDGAPALLAAGSGSARVREVFVLLRLTEIGVTVEELPASGFFSALKAQPDFAGSELNVEGMVIIDDGRTLRLFNRGNGAPRGATQPINATIDVELQPLLAHLRGEAALPPISNVRQFPLGAIGGARLTFTDATMSRHGVLFTAAAEASKNVIDDGQVAGTRLGLIRFDASHVLVPILDESDAPLLDKVEGIALDPNATDRAWLVVDNDDPSLPADLLAVALPVALR